MLRTTSTRPRVLAAVARASERYKVVIQVSENDPAKWNLALNNARNVQAELGDTYGGISYVPGGVIHIMKRQREGWAYIRP